MANGLLTAEALLMERFPQLGILSSLWVPLETEEEPLPHLHLQNVQALYFYGIGTGAIYFQAKNWLKEDPERELIFLEDNPGKIAFFLQTPQAVEILSDPQVQLSLLSKSREELALLSERLPEKKIEVAALPSYHGRKFQNIRLELLRKTTLTHALHLDRMHGYQPLHNFLKNLEFLPRSFYANSLKNSFRGVPAVVCGAGPSLQSSMDTLRLLENRALLIAGGSTLAALSSQGISPHFGIAVDPNLEEYRRFKNNFAFETPLLYSTRVFPAIFQTCNGPFGYMRCGIGGILEVWLEEELGLLDPLIGDFLSPESISVTAICVAYAQFLGCNPILLNGVDLAYTGKKRYALGVAEEEELKFSEIDGEKSAADRIVKRKDRNGKPIYTAVRWIMESASLSYFAEKHPEVRFLNTTEGGIGFRKIEFMQLAEAARQFLQTPYDLRSRIHQQIANSSLPERAKETVDAKIQELKESLHRLIGYLRILAKEAKGSAVLAELEMKDELAFSLFFYDLDQMMNPVLDRTFRPWMPGETASQKEERMALRSETKWKKTLDLALRYSSIFG